MYFYNLIKELSYDKRIIIYVDMDGVIASYDFGKPLVFSKKRPLLTNINTIKKLCDLDNVELHILSVCRYDKEIKEKNDWLDKYASFFKKDMRVIISKESNPGILTSMLKLNYLKSLETKEQLVLIDDDNDALKVVRDGLKGIILYQDSELID